MNMLSLCDRVVPCATNVPRTNLTHLRRIIVSYKLKTSVGLSVDNERIINLHEILSDDITFDKVYLRHRGTGTSTNYASENRLQGPSVDRSISMTALVVWYISMLLSNPTSISLIQPLISLSKTWITNLSDRAASGGEVIQPPHVAVACWKKMMSAAHQLPGRLRKARFYIQNQKIWQAVTLPQL